VDVGGGTCSFWYQALAPCQWFASKGIETGVIDFSVMVTRRGVLVQVDQLHRPPLWLVATPEEEAAEEERGRQAVATGGRWVPGLAAGVERDPDTGFPLGYNSGWPISQDLKERLNLWADASEEREVDERQDSEWLSSGKALAAEVQGQLGPEYEVFFGHGPGYSGEPHAGQSWPSPR
jgi:hypothetical protein